MDFTQIMQRYVRLKEKFNQGEVDADSFEAQVNRMVYKDDLGRYWQIGVESGKWYYYDGEKWVQDDLLEDDSDVEEPVVEVEPAQEDVPEFSVENFFAADDSESGPSTQEAFDLAFEEQLAEQFADSSDSQQFNLFNEDDIFAGLLNNEPMDEEDLMAPAEEVEGLAEHLMATQPVSIENWMGEGEAYSGFDDNDQAIDFLFEDDDDAQTDTESVSSFTDEDLAALLFDESADDEDEEDFDEIRPMPGEREVVTGELNVKALPVSEDEIHELFTLADEEEATTPFPTTEQPIRTKEFDLPTGEGFEIIENEDDLAELPWEASEEFLAETQPVSALEDAEELEVAGLFDLPQLEPVPVHDDEPMLETMQFSKTAKAKPRKKSKKQWVMTSIAAIAALVFIGAILIGGYLIFFKGGTGFSPLAQESAHAELAPGEKIDEFDDPTSGWPVLSDYSVGVSAYNSGFYYLYAIAPEPPTVAVMDKAVYSDVILEVDTTQVELDGGALSTYGLMCRVQENGDGYAFRITNNGQYVVERYVSGVFQPINGWKYSAGIKAGKDVNKNHLEMYCEGNQLTFIVNGQVLEVVVDTEFSSGYIAFVAQTGSAQVNTEVHYDDLFLKVP